jgi:DNA-binding IclR family transcriptional regulator
MPQTKQSYLRVPRHLVSDRSMRSSDVRVFAVLIDLSRPSREIDDGLDEITARTGLTKRTVCEVLTRLETRGFISRESRRGPYTGLIRLNA